MDPVLMSLHDFIESMKDHRGKCSDWPKIFCSSIEEERAVFAALRHMGYEMTDGCAGYYERYPDSFDFPAVGMTEDNRTEGWREQDYSEGTDLTGAAFLELVERAAAPETPFEGDLSALYNA